MPNKFDRVIHENFKGLTMALMNRIMNFQQIEVVQLPRKVQRTLERGISFRFSSIYLSPSRTKAESYRPLRELVKISCY